MNAFIQPQSETDTDSLLHYLQESFTFGVKGKPNTAIIGGGGRGVERVVVLGGPGGINHSPQCLHRQPAEAHPSSSVTGKTLTSSE